MRITALVIFILCINLSSAILGTLGLFQTNVSDANLNGQINNIDETRLNSSYLGVNVVPGGAVQQVGDFISGLYTFTTIFVTSIFMPQSMLENFGVPHDIARWFTFPIYLIYIIAIIQMISGRYVE